MSQKHPRRRRPGAVYAMIPDDVLRSEACRTLPNLAFRALVTLAAQFRGKNNGDLALTWSTGQPYGLNNKGGVTKALKLLTDRGLIVLTRQGGKPPIGCNLYALGWHPINASDKYDAGVKSTFEAPNRWAFWREEKNQKHCPQSMNGLAAVQDPPVIGLPAVQKQAKSWTARSAPSRVLGRGTPTSARGKAAGKAV